MVSTSLPAAGLPAGNGVGLPVGPWREPHGTEWGGCPQGGGFGPALLFSPPGPKLTETPRC